jgi:hypothetical protein
MIHTVIQDTLLVAGCEGIKRWGVMTPRERNERGLGGPKGAKA